MAEESKVGAPETAQIVAAQEAVVDRERLARKWSVFTWPRILYTEVAVANNATVFVNSEDLRTGRDMLIDWIVVSEDTYATIGVLGANLSYLSALNVDWWITDRPHFAPQGPILAAWLDNVYAREHTANPVQALTVGTAQYMTRHPLRWRYEAMQNIAIEWSNPVSIVATGNLGVTVGLPAVGVVTGHRRGFGLGFVFATNAVAATQGIASVTGTMANPGDQPYLVEGIAWMPSNAAWAALNDNRITNHVRMRVRPTQGDAWSDVPVPMIFYGVHKGQPNRAAWYAPAGGPLLLRRNQRVQLELFNNGSGVNMLAQVAVIGRTAPGYPSVA